MAIEPAIIAAGPTITRAEANIHCLRLFDDVPTPRAVVREWKRDLGQWKAYSMPTDEVLGMIAVQPPGSELAYLYIAVDKTWKPVSISSEVIDPGTGKPWDPLASLYTPLAS